MAVRTDVFSIDWDLSPRIINIDISFVEANAQDLYDTCKHLEPLNLDEEQICDAGGLEPLGGGVKNGITVSLFNAKYKFADRAGPDTIICNMTGGNVVAFTDKTRAVELYPREPSTFVSADRTASSSATVQEQELIRFASYNGGITVDIDNLTGNAKNSGNISGGILGSLQDPCDNLGDTAIQLSDVGLSQVYVIGDLEVSDETNWIRTSFIGDSPNKSLFTINAIAEVLNCEFYNATITGTLDGNSYIQGCVISGLNFVDGIIEDCFLGPGTIQLGTSTVANIVGCRSNLPGPDQAAIIDMNQSGILSVRDYTGGGRCKNYNDIGAHSIDLARGQWILEDTITSGTFVVRGIGKLLDEYGDSILSDIDDNGRPIPTIWNGVTILNELLNTENISRGLLLYDSVNLP